MKAALKANKKPLFYTLEGHTPVPCDLVAFGQMFQDIDKRTIARDEVKGAIVSTVFLGIDHNFTGKGPPLLFETMIFGGPHDGNAWRYATWEEAEAQHKWVVEEI